ncbi:MAG: helix-turn-helix transcriptional regulator [Verrucomicrobiae bacterium]|nr:helix-turn-helix transcriptional regulator [Verrucomicrobiae bacterium]
MTDKDILKALGRNIRNARLRAGLTLECVAEMVGCHWTTVAYIEAGRHPFQVTKLVRLARCLKVSSDRFLEGIPEEDPRRLSRIAKALARRHRLPKSQAKRR